LNKTGKILTGIGVVAVVGGAAYGGYKLLEAIDKINITPAKTYDFSLKGEYISFKQDLNFTNPNDKKIKIRLNDIQGFYNDTTIGFLQPAVREFTIPANSSYKLIGIKVLIPKLKLGSALLNVGKNIFFNNSNENTDILSLLKAEAAKVKFIVFGKVNNHKFEETIPLYEEPKEPQKPQNGLGLTALTGRTVRPGHRFDKWFPKINKTDKIVMPNGLVEDTVKLMIGMVKKYHNDTYHLSKYLHDKTLYKTLQNIWTWVYLHINYKPDTPGIEQLRRPARAWHDRHSGVDCDCYSIFIGSILYNLGIPFKFRIAKYDGKSYFQHVYVVVPTKNKKEIIIDDVLDRFNQEKPTSEHKDSELIINNKKI